MKRLVDIGEQEAIRRLAAGLGTHPLLRTGAGDDCAVTRIEGAEFDQVYTTDPVIENVHFLPADQPERIGNKAAGRVFSDLASMGAQPQWLLVNVVASPEQDIEFLEKIYAGMNALCDRFGAAMIGGDLARGTCLELHVFGTGILPSGSALLRSGARVGDHLMVTGSLGGSRTGHHLDFVPRIEEGLFLRETGWVTAMMDVSDGLATDLRHILAQSGVGARLDAERIPMSGSLDQALYDGEDFELLFTVTPEQAGMLRERWDGLFETRLSEIGTITAETHAIRIVRQGNAEVLKARAFEHFVNNMQDG